MFVEHFFVLQSVMVFFRLGQPCELINPCIKSFNQIIPDFFILISPFLQSGKYLWYALLFEGTKEELKTNARAAGFPTDNLEDTFLAMIDEDNRRRGGTV